MVFLIVTATRTVIKEGQPAPQPFEDSDRLALLWTGHPEDTTDCISALLLDWKAYKTCKGKAGTNRGLA